MEKIKQAWGRISAENKRRIVVGSAIALLVVIAGQFLMGERIDREPRVEPSNVRLTGDNTDSLGMEAMNSRINQMREEREELEEELRRMIEEKKESETDDEEAPDIHEDYQRQIDRLHQRINRQQRELRDKGLVVGDDGEIQEMQNQKDKVGEQLQDAFDRNQARTEAQQQDSQSNTPEIPDDIWDDSESFQTGARPGLEEDGEREAPEAQMTTIESSSDSGDADDDSGEQSDDRESQYLPSGSMLSGILITGLDAPTSQEARSEPHPALLRIKDEAILPNRYRADLRECFIILSGYGDMSSERAYMRAENLSCIDDEGNALETKLEAFAVGEDGSAGIRGRLVRRTGQMLAKATMASFISAGSDVFSSTPVPTIQTEGSSTTPFQQALSGESAQASALSGTGKAMERIADYYMDMAENMFPVIEIDAGRKVELIINQGTEIDFEQ